MIGLLEFVVVWIYAVVVGVLFRRTNKHIIDDRHPLSTLIAPTRPELLTPKGRELREEAIRFYRRGGLVVAAVVAVLEILRRLTSQR
jgi:hypothetical protein